jgi:SAM-dependent methyltransferase
MLEYVTKILRAAEGLSSVTTRDDAFSYLRNLGFEDFGEVLMLMPMPEYPKLSRLLPRMASNEVQLGWAGHPGYGLLQQSVAFTRSLAFNNSRFGIVPISRANILDYGCGYGRLARLMYYFVDSSQVYGVDPWERSIEECHNTGLIEHFNKSDFLPDDLPVGDVKFDLAYAFSVYTHLSERTVTKTLGAIRKHMNAGGVAVITIRPVEFWASNEETPPALRDEKASDHYRAGFAFFPQGWEAEDGEATYGNASMTLEWIDQNVPRWKRMAIDRSLLDPYQLYVVLKAV